MVFMNKGKLTAAFIAAGLIASFAGSVTPSFTAPCILSASAEEGAEEYTEGTFGPLGYRKYPSGITITSCDKTVEEVEIPSEIDGVKVTVIGESSFDSCAVSSLVIPDTVTELEFRAFMSCSNLKSVEVPASVKTIGVEAFAYSENLETVRLNEGLTAIYSAAFALTGVREINFPSTVTTISTEVMQGTPWLTEQQEKDPLVIVNGIVIDGKTCKGDVVIPENIRSVSKHAFSLNMELTSVKLPDDMAYIGDCAFMYCMNLKKVELPDRLKVLESAVFMGCNSLESVKLPKDNAEIRADAFNGCTSLAKVEFPSQQVDVYENAFKSTPWLDSLRAEDPLVIVNNTLIDGKKCEGDVVIPEGVSVIAPQAFAENEKITSVSVPSTVKTLRESTFANCTALTSAELKGVEYIAPEAFSGCAMLEKLKLPGCLHKIDDSVFLSCTHSSEITFSGTRQHWLTIVKGEYNTFFFSRAKYTFSKSGDVNDDGEVTVEDAVALQKWLLGADDAELVNPFVADVCSDGVTDTFDLCALRKLLVK